MQHQHLSSLAAKESSMNSRVSPSAAVTGEGFVPPFDGTASLLSSTPSDASCSVMASETLSSPTFLAFVMDSLAFSSVSPFPCPSFPFPFSSLSSVISFP